MGATSSHCALPSPLCGSLSPLPAGSPALTTPLPLCRQRTPGFAWALVLLLVLECVLIARFQASNRAAACGLRRMCKASSCTHAPHIHPLAPLTAAVGGAHRRHAAQHAPRPRALSPSEACWRADQARAGRLHENTSPARADVSRDLHGAARRLSASAVGAACHTSCRAWNSVWRAGQGGTAYAPVYGPRLGPHLLPVQASVAVLYVLGSLLARMPLACRPACCSTYI